MYAEDDLLPLSGLQHLLYCPRQWALIHVEQAWAENRLTAEGRLLHERADSGERETRHGVRVARAIALQSLRLGLSGKADVVEFHPGEGGGAPVPVPVEYKRGRPKAHRADEVQLCAQALCLEEMLGACVPLGFLFYGEPRRRTEVAFDEPLRALTEQSAARMHALHRAGRTPPPEYEKAKCGACSLIELCQPKALDHAGRKRAGGPSAQAYLARALAPHLEDAGANGEEPAP
ncbi:MAG: CRISPR-associated protein Cas4 [Sumerlaeia bacterium]